MRERIIDLLEKVDLALAESVGVIPPADLVPVAKMRDEIRTRLAYPEYVLVTGLVGGTGSGKSSLLNALAGEEVSQTGGLRPTTGEPIAYLSATQSDAMTVYLDHLGLDRRSYGEGAKWLCVIDLPDTDSVIVDHRHTVAALLPVLDVIVWVLDPEKYRDAATHTEIARLSEYKDQFLFVLNQIDRLVGTSLPALETDLRAALADDGIESPRIFLVAAKPAAGPPIRIDAVTQALEDLLEVRCPVYKKLLSDLTTASSALVGVTSGAGGLDFERRWVDTLDEVTERLEEGRSSEARHAIASLLDEIAREADDETSSELLRLSGELPDLTGAAMDVVPGLATTRRRGLRKRPTVVERVDLAWTRASLDKEVAQPVRRLLKRRARSHAAVSDLHLSLLDARRRLD